MTGDPTEGDRFVAVRRGGFGMIEPKVHWGFLGVETDQYVQLQILCGDDWKNCDSAVPGDRYRLLVSEYPRQYPTAGRVWIGRAVNLFILWFFGMVCGVWIGVCANGTETTMEFSNMTEYKPTICIDPIPGEAKP